MRGRFKENTNKSSKRQGLDSMRCLFGTLKATFQISSHADDRCLARYWEYVWKKHDQQLNFLSPMSWKWLSFRGFSETKIETFRLFACIVSFCCRIMERARLVWMVCWERYAGMVCLLPAKTSNRLKLHSQSSTTKICTTEVQPGNLRCRATTWGSLAFYWYF